MKFKLLILVGALFLFKALMPDYSFAKARRNNGNGNSNRSRVSFDFLIGYAIPINASYIDTYQNSDIYWNPNSGFNLDMRLTFKCNDYFYIAVPVDLVVGFYRYKTTDGRKVNTEAQAGNVPETWNNEWSVAPNFSLMALAKPGKHPAVPYLGIGVGVALMVSFESWDFTNVNGDDCLLIITKYYWPNPILKGELGWNVPIKNGFSFRFAATFNLANFIMRRVELTNYYVDGKDTIGQYDEKSTVYNYAFNAPDENKGGDCLLAGFTYKNYPQQKIGTNIAIKIGFAYTFKRRK